MLIAGLAGGLIAGTAAVMFLYYGNEPARPIAAPQPPPAAHAGADRSASAAARPLPPQQAPLAPAKPETPAATAVQPPAAAEAPKTAPPPATTAEAPKAAPAPTAEATTAPPPPAATETAGTPSAPAAAPPAEAPTAPGAVAALPPAPPPSASPPPVSTPAAPPPAAAAPANPVAPPPQPSPPATAAINPPAPQPAAPAATPIEALNEALGHFECASLRGRLTKSAGLIVSGTIPDPDEKAWLGSIAQRYFPNSHPQIKVDIVQPPLCRSLVELDAFSRVGLLTEGDMSLRLVNAISQLREGDLIKIEVHAPDFPVNVRIDYFSIEGQVQHLWPNDEETDPKLAANDIHVFGEPGIGKTWHAGGAPFGTEVIAVIATPQPLPLGRRAWVEESGAYLRDLKSALAAITPPAKPNMFQTLLVNTRPR